MEEAEELHKQRERAMEDANGVSTANEIDHFLKSQHLFGADIEDSDGESSPTSPHGKKVRSLTSLERSSSVRYDSSPTRARVPRPPASGSFNPNISPRAGSMITTSARASRHTRATQWATVNLDTLGDELVSACRADGQKSRLTALKRFLQTQVMHQMALLMLIHKDLQSLDAPAKSSNQEEKEEECIPPRVNSTQHIVDDGVTCTRTMGKKKRVVVKLGPHLAGETLDDPAAALYVSSGLNYAQSICREVGSYEQQLRDVIRRNTATLLRHCGNKKSSSDAGSEDDKPNRESNTLSNEEIVVSRVETSKSEGYEEGSEAEDEIVPLPPQPQSHQHTPPGELRKTTVAPADKGRKKKSKKNNLGQGMQSGRVLEIQKKKIRDMEYVKRLNQPQQDSANNECSGVAEWSNENKFRNVCVDILVSELNSSADIPIELGMAKLSSMNLIHASEKNSKKKSLEEQTSRRSIPVGGRPSYASQHKNLLIQGMGAL